MPQEQDKRPLMQRLFEDASEAVADLIYEKVNALLGAGDQLFTMEFPARPLNQSTYRYNADSAYSGLTKPTAVQEAEFTLSDALYDTAPIVQAGNGDKLSVVYNNLLNNYVPKLDFLKDFVTDKNHLRQWLLTEVDDVELDKNHHPVPSATKISRMELCKKLYGLFLEERNNWYQEKNRQFNESRGDSVKLEEYAQWLTSEALVRDEELNNLFNDAVVRGNYHEVMTILGFLNVESPSEMLEKTKQNMRACQKRSLDGSGSVYPVQFEPSDWFKGLTPNLHPKDLTMSVDALLAEFKTKQKALKALERKLSELEETQISEEELNRLKDNAAKAKAELTQAEKAAVESFGKGALEAFHMAINIYRAMTDPVTQFAGAVDQIEQAREGKITELTGINKQMYDLLDGCSQQALEAMRENFGAVCDLSDAAENAVSAQAEYAASMTQNQTELRNDILAQIQDIQADLDYLKPLVSGTLNASAMPGEEVPADAEAEGKSPLLPEGGGDASDSNFMDVIITSESLKKRSNESSSSTADQSSWKVGGWFFGASHSSSSSSASHQSLSESDASRIEIGFRVMKVSIDRGQWFDSSIFKMTNSFYHLSESRCAPGINKDDIRAALAKTNADEALKALLTYTQENQKCSYLLPSFPTSFVIAKDITIRVKVDQSEEEENKSYAETQGSTSGGVFGFSASSASSSKNCSESAYVGSRNQYIYIRIPGPQILGWFQQMVPADQSEKYAPMGENPYENVLKMLNGPIPHRMEETPTQPAELPG